MKGIAALKKIAKKERAKGCRLQENSQEGESKVLPPLKEIICVCVCVCEKRHISLVVRHTQDLL